MVEENKWPPCWPHPYIPNQPRLTSLIIPNDPLRDCLECYKSFIWNEIIPNDPLGDRLECSKSLIWNKIIPNHPLRDSFGCSKSLEIKSFQMHPKGIIWNEIISIEQTILLVKDHFQRFESSFGMISFQKKNLNHSKRSL